MSNSIGEKFRITSFGSSHGKALGAVVDGCPANLELTVEDIQKELDKRKPGTSSVTTPRKEEDEVQILSGIFEGKTDGTPITGVVFNKNQHSKDYSMFKSTPRPSHGDFGWMMKYGNYQKFFITRSFIIFPCPNNGIKGIIHNMINISYNGFFT